MPDWPYEILARCPLATVVVAADGAVAYANAAARELVDELAAVDPATWSHVRDAARTERPLRLAMTSGRAWQLRAWAVTDGAVALAGARVPRPDERVDRVRDGLGLGHDEAVLALMAARGLSNKAIANCIDVPLGTVSTRLWRLYRKLEVRNRAELASVVAERESVEVRLGGSDNLERGEPR
jgi:ATP/maltotriose-dependent transcriptional regulator MalT